MEFGKVIKQFKSKKGNDVVFRYLKEDDLNHMLTYINVLIREDTYIGLCGKPLTKREEAKVLRDVLKNMDKGDQVHIEVIINGKYGGNGEVHRDTVRRKKHMGELGISLAKEYREEGIGTELMRTLIDEGKKMGLRLLTLNCFENNPRALHIYEKLGFVRAGVVPGAIVYKGSYCGEVKFYLPLV